MSSMAEPTPAASPKVRPQAARPMTANAASTRGSLRREWDAALPRNYTNVKIRMWDLSYFDGTHKLKRLTDLFASRNALRYMTFLRFASVVFLFINIVFVAYDVGRFHQDRNILVGILLLRFLVIVPAALAVLMFTYSQRYLTSPNLLAVPYFIAGIGLIAYSVVGREAGYGTLAAMVVFMFSFTPITFFVCSVTSLALILSFIAAMIFIPAEEWVKNDAILNNSVNTFGVLAIFFVAVATVGHLLELSLRSSFLAEVKMLRQRDMLQHEEELSNKLLANMLPPSVAEQLKEGRTMIADEYSKVTVLFCELCNWSNITEHLAATKVVTVLNLIYSTFDRLIEPHGVYKVETVGEVYMVVGGCPSRAKDHAARCADMAIAMMAAMPHIRMAIKSQLGGIGQELQIRVGLNSGPIVAGIVGIRNPRYKLFGDTVNTASRMESTSMPGRIHISRATYLLLAEEFNCLRRGMIDVKGKGKMETFFLMGRAGEPSVMQNVGVHHLSMRDMIPSHMHVVDVDSKDSVDHKSSKPLVLSQGRDPVNSVASAGAGAGAGALSPRLEEAADVWRTPNDVGELTANSPNAHGFWHNDSVAAAKAVRELFESRRTPVHHLAALFEDKNGSARSLILEDDDDADTAVDSDSDAGDSGSSRSTNGEFVITLQPHSSNNVSGNDLANAAISESKSGSPVRATLGTGPASTNSSFSKGFSSALSMPKGVMGDIKKVKSAAKRTRSQPGRHMVSSYHFGASARSLNPCAWCARIPMESRGAVCCGRRGKDRMGLMEPHFRASNAQRWLRFLRAGLVMCALALVVFLVQDELEFRDSDQGEQDKKDRIHLMRYAILEPILVIFFAMTFLPQFEQNSWFTNISTTFVMALIGAGVVVISMSGKDPGFGVLSVYVVFCFNLSIVPFAYRAVTLGLLIAAHVLALPSFVAMNLHVELGDRKVVFTVLEQLGYLLVFYFGQGVPVLGTEFYMRENYIRRMKLDYQRAQLEVETEHSNALLESMLPKTIARQLKDGANCIAGHFDCATILFTDMRGFTAFSSKVSPQQLLGFLNGMFSKFDEISIKYGIHKVEIIGDAYFAVGGCPTRCEDHAERCAAAAVEMLDFMPVLRKKTGADINMRVGIHVGQIDAGVVGTKDPRYHLFGNTVSMAMLMESSGVPGKIHLSEDAFNHFQRRQGVSGYSAVVDKIAGPGEFKLAARDAQVIRGHRMQTYFLDRVKPQQA